MFAVSDAGLFRRLVGVPVEVALSFRGGRRGCLRSPVWHRTTACVASAAARLRLR